MECKHQFKGHSKGGTCVLYGFHMAHDEYVESLKKKPRKSRKKVKK